MKYIGTLKFIKEDKCEHEFKDVTLEECDDFFSIPQNNYMIEAFIEDFYTAEFYVKDKSVEIQYEYEADVFFASKRTVNKAFK